MGVPEPLLDVVRVPVGIDVAVMIAMKGGPPQGGLLEGRRPKGKAQEGDQRMGLERPVGEQAVVPDGDADPGPHGKGPEQDPLGAGEADLDGVPRKRGETH